MQLVVLLLSYLRLKNTIKRCITHSMNRGGRVPCEHFMDTVSQNASRNPMKRNDSGSAPPHSTKQFTHQGTKLQTHVKPFLSDFTLERLGKMKFRRSAHGCLIR